MILLQTEIRHLKALLETSQHTRIDNFTLIKDEEVASKFLIEFSIDKLSQDTANTFWWSPRLIIVNQIIVGMIGFKSTPKPDLSVEIGYGIIGSQQNQGFATEAVKLLLEEAFYHVQIHTVTACTYSLNIPSQRVLEKNGFIKQKSKINWKNNEIWIWKKRNPVYFN